ncbi:PTS fructose transporter subunit IIABC [Terribacillus saccharophilus]|uniref:PTS system, fructose-specific IIC component n=1 Tax=Terribacillus saccharophilus TaxID=361277 RepID=A0AAX2EEV4_9BACI|nr:MULTISPECIES: fructose-specific PTS transporter subunit EIIC [Terribacillus]MCM3226413.1 fructose-specific PTS transporter subunit EIIC [Terribacillus saccharophilus]MEC0282285.1 fructose-specific PTS transporter subunit EIIC [Terribacillus saccharophilus]MEC0288956.1 fructose-specific PTS transporter subunit EIIC [Terribacillus saccharophilus]SEN20005.1 PTS system, fructose-specific IIC component [Terribacillus saccharophilus]
MRITELLTKDTVILQLQSQSKADVIEELVSKLDQAGKLNDKAGFKDAILAREAQSTTGIGEGIAIPHGKSAAVKTPAIAFGRSKEGLDYEALDGQPSHLFFMIAASEGANQTHLETLSRLSSFLMDSTFRSNIENAETEEQIMSIIDAKEKEELGEEEEQENPAVELAQDAPGTQGKVLAITACPTGIAHTFMAADKLKQTAAEMNVPIKVQTNGAGGVKNRLTDEDIKDATAIIVAADVNVDLSPFDGKHVLQVPVGRALKIPKELIEKALSQDAPVHHNSGGGSEAAAEGGQKKEQRSGFYKHIMNGVSNMLPFVVGGGILIALSILFGELFPDSRFAEMLNEIGSSQAFFLIVPVLAGFISSSIADKPGFAPGAIGGLIAVTYGHGDATSSGFLGGLIAGFLAGYVTLGIKKALSGLPPVLEGLKTILFFPVLSIFITGMIMLLINPSLTQVYVALSNFLEGLGGTNLVLVGIVLGAMMAIDMGGPINKAAYTFGIAMLDAGNLEFMAAVMAGGMVPPLGLALATSLFRHKFTKQERETGKTAYVLGAFFISEGVIPFAAADPLRVIPATAIGAAVAGGLSAFFAIGLNAPHGGIISASLVDGNPLLYFLSIIIGAFVTAIIVGLLKKDLRKV